MIYIKNAVINTITNGIIRGEILIENSQIEEIAEKVVAPLDAEVIDACGNLVFPGFIDAHTHLGLCEDGMGVEGADENEMTDPITPQLDPIDGINPMDITLKEAYQGGITSVCVTPGSSNVMGGKCTTIKTYGRRIDDMVIKKLVALKVAFGENPKHRYGGEDKMPQTRMAIAAMLRENIQKAKEYQKALEIHEKSDEDESEKPEYDIKLESIIPAVEGEVPLKVHAHRADDMFTAIRIAKEYDLKLTLDHCTEGHLIVDELKKENYPLIVGPSLSDRSKVELRNLTFETAGRLSNAGIDICLMTDHPVIPIQYLPICAGLAIKNGMKEEKALQAITINPAKTLGIDDRVGSLEVGKDADVVIWSGSPFEVQSRVLKTIINGKVVFEG